MDDLVVFEILRDKTIPDKVRKALKKAFNSHDKDKVEEIVDDILVVKFTTVLLNKTH